MREKEKIQGETTMGKVASKAHLFDDKALSILREDTIDDPKSKPSQSYRSVEMEIVRKYNIKEAFEFGKLVNVIYQHRRDTMNQRIITLVEDGIALVRPMWLETNGGMDEKIVPYIQRMGAAIKQIPEIKRGYLVCCGPSWTDPKYKNLVTYFIQSYDWRKDNESVSYPLEYVEILMRDDFVYNYVYDGLV